MMGAFFLFNVKISTMSEPIRHHYIPQFWLKTFCEDPNDGYVRYIDIKTGKESYENVKNIFYCNRLYEDEENHPEDAEIIEKTLSKFESEIQPLFKKIVYDKEIILSEQDYFKLFIFLELEIYRNNRNKVMLRNHAKAKDIPFVETHDYNKFISQWKNEIFELSKIRAPKDVASSNLDQGAKFQLQFDLEYEHLLIFETKDIPFIISDTMPIVLQVPGLIPNVKVPVVSILPISPRRVAVIALNDIENTHYRDMPISKEKLRSPIIKKSLFNVYNLKPRLLYKKDVIGINEALKRLALEGYIIK